MEAYNHEMEIVICLNYFFFYFPQIDHLEHLAQLQLSLINQLLQKN